MNKVVLFNNCTKKVLILICLMMIFSLFSCSNMLLDNDLSQNQDEVLVTFSINSGSGNSSRTILPKIISNEEIQSLDMEIRFLFLKFAIVDIRLFL